MVGNCSNKAKEMKEEKVKEREEDGEEEEEEEGGEDEEKEEEPIPEDSRCRIIKDTRAEFHEYFQIMKSFNDSDEASRTNSDNQ